MTQKTLVKHLDEYTELTRQIAGLEARKQAVADRIKDAMGDQCGDYAARYKAVTSSRFDTKAFQQAHKRLYTMFCKPQTVRRFTVTA